MVGCAHHVAGELETSSILPCQHRRGARAPQKGLGSSLVLALPPALSLPVVLPGADSPGAPLVPVSASWPRSL